MQGFFITVETSVESSLN